MPIEHWRRPANAAYLASMTLEPRLERRVDRLGTEAVAIYDLIRDETHDVHSTLAEHTTTLAGHGEVLAQQTPALDEILRRLPEPRR